MPSYKIDYSNPDTIENLITKMDLLCEPNYHSMLATIGAITLFGFLVGSLTLLPYADHHGRRKMNILFLSCMTLAMWIFLGAMSFCGIYWLILFACFLAGCVSIPLISVMICYATELSTLEMVPMCTCLSFFAEALTSVIIGVYFKY